MKNKLSRLKSDEPEFKVGDWFTLNSKTHCVSGMHQITDELIELNDVVCIYGKRR